MSKEGNTYDLEDRLIELEPLIDEDNQLISIFVKSIDTTKRKSKKTFIIRHSTFDIRIFTKLVV